MANVLVEIFKVQFIFIGTLWPGPPEVSSDSLVATPISLGYLLNSSERLLERNDTQWNACDEQSIGLQEPYPIYSYLFNNRSYGTEMVRLFTWAINFKKSLMNFAWSSSTTEIWFKTTHGKKPWNMQCLEISVKSTQFRIIEGNPKNSDKHQAPFARRNMMTRQM